MRLGLIAKGAGACYDIDGDDMISNVHINFNRLQYLPLRNADPFDSEQITNADPYHSPKKRRERSRSPGGSRDQGTYRERGDVDQSKGRYQTRRPPRTIHDSSYKPMRGKEEEPQEVKA